MSLWVSILVAAAIAYGLKLAGHLVPARLLAEPHAKRVTAALPIAVAVAALLLRAPFIVVVVLGAATAAGLRALGWA